MLNQLNLSLQWVATGISACTYLILNTNNGCTVLYSNVYKHGEISQGGHIDVLERVQRRERVCVFEYLILHFQHCRCHEHCVAEITLSSLDRRPAILLA